ncbi:lateral flagellar hook associated protein 1 (FlgK-like) [Escherichia coli]|nr:lateral flagellar hook associated protein 1 (FlgK-like) [Escherichia coli]
MPRPMSIPQRKNQQSGVSGVSMDEEAVNLITYQQIYEAN